MKRLFLIFLITLAASALNADPITWQNAQQLAKSFFAQKGISMSTTSPAAKAPRKNVTAKEADSYYYIFNAGNNNGFVVVSGSNQTEQILGYTDSGAFDPSNTPENMKSWLQGYADEIKHVEESPASITPESDTQKARHTVLPLLPMLWNQNSPYNTLCPIYNKSDGTSSGNRSATGCVATAFAQVIGYYKYPNQTALTIPSYSFTSGGASITMDAIPAGTTIDWSNMRDTYSSSNTEDEINAVAKLMLIVGTGCKMAYGSSSSASMGCCPQVLRDYLGYDDAVQTISRDKYSLDKWVSLIYNELENGRPVVYDGASASMGRHAFVLDGYDGKDFFHVNWGWGGSYNGYFRISVLDINSNNNTGANYSSTGFSYDQGAVIGIKLPDNIDDGVTTNIQLSNDNISISGTSITADFFNISGTAGKFYMGLGIVGDDGKITVFKTNFYSLSLANDDSYTLTFNASGLTDGTYKIVPISRQSTSNTWSTGLNPDIKYVKAVVANGVTKLTYCYNADSNLKISNWKFTGSKVASQRQELQATFTNAGGPKEFSGILYCFASTTSTKGNPTCKAGVTVKPDKTDSISFFFTPSIIGTYNVWIASDPSGNNIIGQSTVNITSTSTQVLNLSIPSVTFANTNNRVTYGNFINATICFQNNATTDFDGNILINLYHGSIGATSYGLYTSKIVHATIASKAAILVACQFDGLTVDSNYGFIFQYTGSSSSSITGSTSIQYAHLTTLRPGAVYYSPTGSMLAFAPSETMNAGDISAIDMRGTTTITRISPSSNPNAVYVVDGNANIPQGLEGKNVVHGTEAESISLVDGYPVYFPCSFTAKEISYSKQLNTGDRGLDSWETLALPFSPSEITADGTTVSLKQRDDDSNDLAVKEFSYLDGSEKVHFDYVSTLQANIPYVLKANGKSLTGKTLTFKAYNAAITETYDTKITATTDDYDFEGYTYKNTPQGFYLLNAAGTAFDYHSDSYEMPPFHSFFTTTLAEGNRAASIPIDDAATGIKDIPADSKAKVVNIYTLDGLKIGKANISNGIVGMPALPKGVYIINGKKVIY